MVVVDPVKEAMCLELRGKFGKPTGIGAMWIGWNEIGDEQNLVGYFQRRRGGIWTKIFQNARIGYIDIGANQIGSDEFIKKMSQRSHQKIVLLKHYWPKNTETEKRRAWRNIFADGVQAWKDLTTSERLYYNELKYPTGQSGFTRFMSKYLSEHRT